MIGQGAGAARVRWSLSAHRRRCRFSTPGRRESICLRKPESRHAGRRDRCLSVIGKSLSGSAPIRKKSFSNRYPLALQRPLDCLKHQRAGFSEASGLERRARRWFAFSISHAVYGSVAAVVVVGEGWLFPLSERKWTEGKQDETLGVVLSDDKIDHQIEDVQRQSRESSRQP